MLYFAYQTQSGAFRPLRDLADWSLAGYRAWSRLAGTGLLGRNLSAALELLARAGLSHRRPAFGFDRIAVAGESVAVTEEAVLTTPFGTLLRFRKEGDTPQPRVLVVAPLSGHFATLLRGTIRTLLPDHDVYVTDWHNARDVPLSAGRFDFDDYVDHVIRFLEAIGPGAHVLAVCQPCVQVLAAISVMAEDGNAATPRSATLIAGPVDTRINPTGVNELAQSKPIAWFESNLISTVPWRHEGAGRRVYPGFVQLMAFMAMNPKRHLEAHKSLYGHLARGEHDKARTIKRFYDEYFAVLDLPAEFYLETVVKVFQDPLLAKGELTFRGRPVNPGAIRDTALLTIEGENDDICSMGQTAAALDLCTGLRPALKHHHVQAGAGHYGVFNGRRWESQVYPMVRAMIRRRDRSTGSGTAGSGTAGSGTVGPAVAPVSPGRAARA